MTTAAHLSEENLIAAISSAWSEARQVDITLTSNQVLRGTALIPRHSTRQVALFGLKRPGLPVATAVLLLEEIAHVDTVEAPADNTLGSLLIDGERIDDPAWSYTIGDGLPAYGSALRPAEASS